MSEDGPGDRDRGWNDREEADATARGDAGRSADESTGRIPLDLSSDADEEADEDDSYAPEPNSATIETGDPDLENVAFVLLGAAVTVLVLLRVLSLPF